MKRTSISIGKIISVLAIFVTFCCLYIIVLFRPYFGDDVDKYYMHAPEHAITGIEPSVVRVDNVSLWLDNIRWYYMNFTGRILYILMNTFTGNLSKWFVALLITLIFTVDTLLALRIVFKKLSNALDYPLVVSLFVPLCGLYFYTIQYSTMWVFASIYSLSVCMYLLLLNVTLHYVVADENNTSINKLLGINFIGFVAGVTHEMVGAWYIIGIFCIILYKKGIKGTIKNIKNYIGLIIGYLICFFAPGNFVRLQIPHEDNIRTMSFVSRGYVSVIRHYNAIFRHHDVGKILYIALVVMAVGGFVFCRKKSYIKLLIAIECFIPLSVLMWSCVARAVDYGLVGVMFLQNMVLAFFAKQLCDRIQKESIIKYVSLVAIVLVIVDNLIWVPTMVKETGIRNKKIEQAISKGENVVVVNKYSESVDHEIMGLIYVDSCEEYDTPRAIDFNGILIIPQ